MYSIFSAAALVLAALPMGLAAPVDAANVTILAADGTGISCNAKHGALGTDCEQVFSTFQGDLTVQQPDSHGRASVNFGSCAIVAHYQGGQGYVSNGVIVDWGLSAYQACFQDAQEYESSVQQAHDSIPKYCLCNINSQGSC